MGFIYVGLVEKGGREKGESGVVCKEVGCDGVRTRIFLLTCMLHYFKGDDGGKREGPLLDGVHERFSARTTPTLNCFKCFKCFKCVDGEREGVR